MASREEAAPASTPSPLTSAPKPHAFSARIDRLRSRLVTFDVAAIFALTFLAALLRLWDLGTVPLGLHGDEAWTGLDAWRIVDEGWIGVYVESALGQPAGPLYFTALLFTFLPDTTWTIRFSMAVFGIATIPLAYIAFSLMFHRTVGAFGATILMLMTWHLHLARTGFMVITWPFMEVVALIVLWLAFRGRNPWMFAASGAVIGLGVYSYNAYLLFVPVAFVPVVWWLFRQRERNERIFAGYMLLLVATTALLFALPWLGYIEANAHEYRRHQRIVSVTSTERWQEGNVLDRADVLFDRAREWHNGMVFGGRPDQGDGLAENGLPPLEPVVYVAALVGLGVALWNVRRKEYAVCVAAVLVLPFGALLTEGDGLYRRTLGLTPFIALLAALPLAWLWDELRARRNALSYFGMAAVLTLPAYAGARTVHDYFGPAQDSFTMRIVYPYELDAAARWMDGDLPPETYVYFYSDRWSIGYETVRFLAPDVQGEDRSFDFRAPPMSVNDNGELRFDIDREGPVAFVLLGAYLGTIDRIERDYPGGRRIESRRGEELLFVAYVVE